MPLKFSERLDLYKASLIQFLITSDSIFLLTEMPGNIGDHLIQLGSERILAETGFEIHHITVSEIVGSKSDSPSRGTLVVPGSGAFTHKFHEWLPDLVSRASTQFDRVLVLPSEFEIDLFQVSNALSKDNVFVCARDAVSFRQIRTFGRSSLALDPALYAFDFVLPDESKAEQSDIDNYFLALRTDKASLLEPARLQNAKNNNDISLSSHNLTQFLDTIRSTPVVVTDRLHVVVASVMLGKNVNFINPENCKISRYIQFSFRNEFDKQIRERDVSWLVEKGLLE
jgi:exopolysaccharide biosynthesis predicted pyruvyltransferase EpsI